jgi:hypothetical protein
MIPPPLERREQEATSRLPLAYEAAGGEAWADFKQFFMKSRRAAPLRPIVPPLKRVKARAGRSAILRGAPRDASRAMQSYVKMRQHPRVSGS